MLRVVMEGDAAFVGEDHKVDVCCWQFLAKAIPAVAGGYVDQDYTAALL